jgi:hypothetical protein
MAIKHGVDGLSSQSATNVQTNVQGRAFKLCIHAIGVHARAYLGNKIY